MIKQCCRRTEGGLIDRSREVTFTFDGRLLTGHPGDTLASALLANGVHLMARSFKYHRPRGIYTAGPHEPNALVTLGRGGRSEPNIPATTVEIFDGLEARSQNRWPSLKLDFMAINSLLKPFFPAGFNYKTFMWPRSFWYRLYEPIIRRAAGLGTLTNEPDPDRYEHSHLHADIVIVGAGPAGLVAAQNAARSGARVLLIDEQAAPGGHLLDENTRINGKPGTTWAKGCTAELATMKNVRILSRTTVFGRYDDLTFGAVERASDHQPENDDQPQLQPRQRFWTIDAKQFVCTTGALERPLIFDNNDRPGVMLAGAARSYLNRYGVLPGRRALVFTNNDDAYYTARDLAQAGAAVTVVDTRPRAAGARLLPPEIEILFGHVISDVKGRNHVRGALIRPLKAGPGHGSQLLKRCDLICISGGWNPTTHLLSHLGRKPSWNKTIAGYMMTDPGAGVYVAGGAAGTFNLADSLVAAAACGLNAAKACGYNSQAGADLSVTGPAPRPILGPELEPQPTYGITPLWRLPAALSNGTRSFADLQNDVTVADLELADREGFGHAEHAKRYTTLGMATDQGKLSNVNALGILSQIKDRSLSETGTTTYRPLYSPVSLGALSGQRRGAEFAATRLSAMHQWHEQNGAVFTHAGLWLRPFYYPRPGEDFAAAVKREVLTVRSGVGMIDVSTLGKIELKGPGAGAFLDRLYINSFSKMKIGRARYGLMTREDGMVFDDGTISRLAADHYFITVTTANAAQVLQHMEFCHQVYWPNLDVQFCPVSEVWSAMAIAGSKSRQVLAGVVQGLELSNAAFPFLGVGEATIGGAPVRIFRISFSGELAYEVYTAAGYGLGVWEAIMKAGRSFDITAYGTEAMTVMRTEKGHIAGPELDGRTSVNDLGLGQMLLTKKDYIGRRMANRDGFADHDRAQLVGLKPVCADGAFKMGAHLLDDPEATGLGASKGHITTAVYSPTLNHFIGLALLENGRQRTGSRLYAVSPLHNEKIEVEVTAPVFLDPDGEKMRA